MIHRSYVLPYQNDCLLFLRIEEACKFKDAATFLVAVATLSGIHLSYLLKCACILKHKDF